MYINPNKKPRFEIDTDEMLQIFVSIFAICLSITFANLGLKMNPLQFVFWMTVTAVTVGPGFILHELAHKYVAIKYGSHARYQAWTWGLALMLGMAIIPQLFGFHLPLFLAPGAVMIYAFSRPISPKENGHISVAGPLVNITLALMFLAIAIVTAATLDPVELESGGFTLPVIALMGFQVNIFLAFFNLLPIYPLDGFKVMMWDWRVWLALFAIAFLGTGFVPGL